MSIDAQMKRVGVVDLNKVGVGAVAGLVAGAVIGGVGARVAMRGVALIAGMQPSFSPGGTAAILTIGAIFGMIFGMVYVGVNRFLPGKSLLKGGIYGLILGVLFLGLQTLLAPEGELELAPPLTLIALFGPVPLAYGVALGVLFPRIEGRMAAAGQRRIGLGWLAVFLVFLFLTVIGMVSLGDSRLVFPRAFVERRASFLRPFPHANSTLTHPHAQGSLLL